MDGKVMALLSSNGITIIYGILLIVFFIVLLALTVTLIKAKNANRYYSDKHSGDEIAASKEDKEASDEAESDEIYDDESEEDDVGFEEDDTESETDDVKSYKDDAAPEAEDAKSHEDDTESKTDDVKSQEDDAEPKTDDVKSYEDEAKSEENDSAGSYIENAINRALAEDDDFYINNLDSEDGIEVAANGKKDIFEEADSALKDDLTDSAFTEDNAFPTGSVFEEDEASSNPVSTQKMYVEEELLSDNGFEEEPGAYNVADMEIPADSAFAPELPIDSSWMSDKEDALDTAFSVLTDEALDASVKEAYAMGAAVSAPKKVAKTKQPKKKTSRLSSRSVKKPYDKSNDEFYWYNKLDVEERPSYKTPEMYYHYFNLPEDCIEDLFTEMYDCALVRTEEIRYIAYGIAPRAVSMKEIFAGADSQEERVKTPSTQDRIKIYEKWCGYVDKLFEKIEINADSYTIDKIKEQLYDYGKSDVDYLLEGK